MIPELWAIPPLAVFILSAYAILTGSLQIPFINYKTFGSINGVLFPFLCIYTLYKLKSKKVDNQTTIFLAYVVTLACYGVGEIFSRIWFADYKIWQYNLLIYFWGWMYPLFYFTMNVPFFRDIKFEDRDLETFIKTIGIVFILYGVYSYFLHTYTINEVIITYTDPEYFYLQIPYYLARFVSVTAYCRLIQKSKYL